MTTNDDFLKASEVLDKVRSGRASEREFDLALDALADALENSNKGAFLKMGARAALLDPPTTRPGQGPEALLGLAGKPIPPLS